MQRAGKQAPGGRGTSSNNSQDAPCLQVFNTILLELGKPTVQAFVFGTWGVRFGT